MRFVYDDLGGVVLKSDVDECGGDVFVVSEDNFCVEFVGECEIFVEGFLVLERKWL